MHTVMKITLIIVFTIIIGAFYKKAYRNGLGAYHIIMIFLLFPLVVFLDYCIQRQEILLDLSAIKITIIYGIPLGFIFSLFLYISTRKKEFK